MSGKKNDRFNYLRRRLSAHGIDITYLCELLGREYSYTNDRLRGYAPWSQKDQYIIMEAVNEPAENLHLMFPKDGIDSTAPAAPQTSMDTPAILQEVAKWILAATGATAQSSLAVDPRFSTRSQRRA